MDIKDIGTKDYTEIHGAYMLIANVFNTSNKRGKNKPTMAQDSFPSGSISKMIHHILNNVPIETDPHHSQLKIGHASNAGKCSRQIWFLSNETRENRHPAPVMVFGKAIHNWLTEEILSNPNERIQTDLPVDFRPKYNVIGKLDFMGETSVGELKTTKEHAFKYLEAPQTNHVLQASIYARYYEKRYIEIVYLARDTANLKTFFWPALTNIDSEIERISAISEMHNPPAKVTWDGKKLNPWSAEKVPWECKYCPFRKECLEVDNMGILESTVV